MTLIIANSKGIWADRHTESTRSPHLAGYHANKLHHISEDCVYACTGSIVKAEQYALIYRNFKHALLNGEVFNKLENQDGDLHVFTYKGKVYFTMSDGGKLQLLDDNDDMVAGGSAEELAYLLHYDNLSPAEIIKLTSAVNYTVSAEYDHVTAEGN